MDSKEFFDLFRDAPVGICVLTGQSHVVAFANKHFMDLFFGGARDIAQKPVREALPEVEGQGLFEMLDKVFQTGEPFDGKEVAARILQKDGSLKDFFMDFTLQPMRNADKKITGISAVAADVTAHVLARRQVEASADLLRTIADRLPAFVSYMDSDKRFRFVNQAYEDWFGIPAQKIEGQSREALLNDPKWYEYLAPYEAEALSGKPVSFEMTLKRDGIDRRYLDTEYIPDIDPETKRVRGIVAIGQDVTERKRAAEELKTAKDSAEEANATKSAFLANMSHEIRTPLGAILGFSGLLKDSSLSSDERHQYIEIINRNGQSLTRIIDDILDLAKVEAGVLDIETISFSLFGLLNEVLDLFREKAKQKNIALELKMAEVMPSHILSDPTRLRQILINVIGNAVKFTESGGVIVSVATEPVSERKVQVMIEVKDSGRGISREQRERLFKPFTQADNTTTRRFGGTGLGLALSKRLSQALGGDVSVKSSEIGQGTVFSITFVASEVRTPEQPLRVNLDAQTRQRLSGLRILLVDDSPDNQFLVKRILVKNGADVEVASNGREAVNMAQKSAHNIVLMDIQMPEMDGYQATKTLLTGGYSRPIVALTAHAMVEERAKTKAAGFSGHLTKPLNNEELIETVAGLARRD